MEYRKVTKKEYAKGAENMTENEISYNVIGIAIELHRKLGPGLLESVYENTLAYDLRESGLFVIQQMPVPLIYKEVKMLK